MIRYAAFWSLALVPCIYVATRSGAVSVLGTVMIGMWAIALFYDMMPRILND